MSKIIKYDTCGWSSNLPQFRDTEPRIVRMALEQFVRGAEGEQLGAWDESIPMLQKEADEILVKKPKSRQYHAVLEYQLPLEARRPDVVILLCGPIVILELKTKEEASTADIDQVAAYARDLRCYHEACKDRSVYPVVVPTNASDDIIYNKSRKVHIVGPSGLDGLILELSEKEKGNPPVPEEFLSEDAYQPLPTLVQAARELFESREIREIWRAKASTDPAVNYIANIAHKAAAEKTRHLVIVRGVPGSGKTLVGLRAVHAKYLDDLSIARKGKKPTAPGIFLSGNGPLVEVLKYVLKEAGGGGKTFVRGMKNYLDYYVPKENKIPAHHVIVFDEAQRAFNTAMVANKHKKWDPNWVKSEPELILELAERIPEWSVVVGLIGSGQEIHKGEEEGIGQWCDAINNVPNSSEWKVHLPPQVSSLFEKSKSKVLISENLNLDIGIRYHTATLYDDFVEEVLVSCDAKKAKDIVTQLSSENNFTGIRLLITRDLEIAKQYLWDRYSNDGNARFGIVASSKDKVLEPDFGIPNSFMATKQVKVGPWYADPISSPHSCTQLTRVVTEFGAQGLELDMALLTWGTDLMRIDKKWSIEYARGYAKHDGVPVKDPFALRINAYRVLLTRGRDGTIIFVPPIPSLDETYNYLKDCGFEKLEV